MTQRRHEAGFTYLGVLFMVGLLALTASMASAVWTTAQQREDERQLAFAGRQLQQAIEHYRRHARGNDMPYPRELADLLHDPRAPGVRRFLRQLYVDPMTGRREWGLVRLADGGIVGVHSLSSRKAIGGPPAAPGVSAGATYREWRFLAPSAAVLLAPAGAASGMAATRPDPS